MVIRVTSSRGNKLISGKPLAFNELKKAVNVIMRGHIERDFIDTFCSIYGYKVFYKGVYQKAGRIAVQIQEAVRRIDK